MAELAARQRGLVSTSQLREAGITRGMLKTMTAGGTLYRVLPRVYSLGTPDLQPFGAELAALLHLAHDAVISHRSAAALWDVADGGADDIRVTIIGRGLRPREGLRLHRVSHLHSRDVRLRHGLPVTAPARTLIDLAATARFLELEEALHRARAAELIGDAELDEALERAPRRTGVAAMQRLLASPLGHALIQSRFERLLIALLQDAGLPLPEFNVPVNGAIVDAAWREQRLVLECDSWDFHSSREAFETDRARDQRHAAAGYRVVRITWRQLTEQPLLVVARVAAALAFTGP